MNRPLCLLLLCAGGAAFAEKAPRFSSKYTLVSSDAKTGCKVKIAGEEGQDPVLTCPALKGYDVEMSFSATTTLITVTGEGGFNVAFNVLQHGPKLEWRLADGKPFAVILRATEVVDTESGQEKMTWMQVRGLKGFEGLSASVDVDGANTNARARQAADAGFAAK